MTRGVDGFERVVQPSQWLRPWVSEFRLIRKPSGQLGTLVRLPTASCCLMFRIGCDGRRDLHAAGPLRCVRYKKLDSAEFYVRVTLCSGAARQILGIPVYEIADRIIPLDILWNRAARTLCDQLLDSAPDSAVSVFERVLRLLLEPAFQSEVSPVRHVVQAIEEDPGKPMDEYARLSGLSTRQLRHVFRLELGLSPKRYSRIVRIKQILSQAHREQRFADLAVGGGFYDQAHMIAEFHDLLGSTPRAFLAEWRAIRPAFSASRDWAVKGNGNATDE